MRNKLLFSSVLLAASVSLSAQQSATITLHADQGKQIIPKEIYGQFAEHLGTWVRRPLGRRELRYTQCQRLPYRRIQCPERPPSSRSSLAGRLFCR